MGGLQIVLQDELLTPEQTAAAASAVSTTVATGVVVSITVSAATAVATSVASSTAAAAGGGTVGGAASGTASTTGVGGFGVGGTEIGGASVIPMILGAQRLAVSSGVVMAANLSSDSSSDLPGVVARSFEWFTGNIDLPLASHVSKDIDYVVVGVPAALQATYGEKLSIAVSASKPVSELIASAATALGVSASDLSVADAGGNSLSGSATLGGSGVSNGGSISATLSGSAPSSPFVVTVALPISLQAVFGSTLTIATSGSTTVADLKAVFELLTGMSSSSQGVSFGGSELTSDSQTLTEAGIASGSTVLLTDASSSSSGGNVGPVQKDETCFTISKTARAYNAMLTILLLLACVVGFTIALQFAARCLWKNRVNRYFYTSGRYSLKSKFIGFVSDPPPLSLP